jgi:hypothetical protein
MVVCYLCRDDTNLCYKICTCEDSLLCGDCLDLTNEDMNRIENLKRDEKCSVCRKKLNIYYKTNNYRYRIEKGVYFFTNFIMLLLEYLPFLFIVFDKTQTFKYFNDSRDVFAGVCGLTTIIFKYNMIDLLIYYSYVVDIKEQNKLRNRINLIYTIINIIVFFVFISLNINTLSIMYFSIVILPFYFIPFMSSFLVRQICNTYLYLQILKKECSKKKIITNGFILQS